MIADEYILNWNRYFDKMNLVVYVNRYFLRLITKFAYHSRTLLCYNRKQKNTGKMKKPFRSKFNILEIRMWTVVAN